jgi:hypothetical protein
MGFEDQIGVDDLSLIYPQIAEVVRKILSSEVYCDLSNIKNFDSIAMELNIQVQNFNFFF